MAEPRDYKNLTPYGRRIIIQDPPAEEARASGLILPDGVAGITLGVLLAKGDEVPYLQKGDTIWYYKDRATVIGDRRLLDIDAVVAYDGSQRMF